MLQLQARVEQGAMVMKGYSTFPKAPQLLESHHQIVWCYIWDTWGSVTLLQSGPVGWGCRIHRLVLCREVRLPNSRPKLICFHIRSDLKNPTARFNGRTSTTCLFKILKFSGPSLPGTPSTTQSIHSNGCLALFPVWRFIITDDDCHILSVRA